MHQGLLLANILKLTENVFWEFFTFYAHCDRCYGKSVVYVSCIFQTIILIAVIKIFEKFCEEVEF